MNGEIKNLGSLLPEIYKDAAQPAVRTAGKAIGSVAELILSPIGRCAEIFSKNISNFFDKFDSANEEDIVPPKPNIGVPIFQKLSYTEEEELVELYTELLKKSCLKSSKDKVLPSYVDIISRLTPDEVKIIDYLFREKYVINVPPELSSVFFPEMKKEIVDAPKTTNSVLPYPMIERLPFLEISKQHTSINEYIIIARYFTDIINRVNLANPDNIELYLDNLEAMGIFEIDKGRQIIPVQVYDHLEKSEIIRNHETSIKAQGHRIVLKKGLIQFTSLGTAFIRACTAPS